MEIILLLYMWFVNDMNGNEMVYVITTGIYRVEFCFWSWKDPVTCASVLRSCARSHCAGRGDECDPAVCATQSHAPASPLPESDSGLPLTRTQIVIHWLTAAHKLPNKACAVL
jgi:hypothetical protein